MALPPEVLAALQRQAELSPYQEPMGPPLPPGFAPGMLRAPAAAPATTGPIGGLRPTPNIRNLSYALGLTDDPAPPEEAPERFGPLGEPLARGGDPAESLAFLERLRGGVVEEPAGEGEAEGPAAAAGDRGRLPTIEGPGDIPREKRRAEIERNLAQLTAFRDIAEGLGRAVPVKGEITTRTMPQDFRAEGIQDEILRMGQELGLLQRADVESQLQQEALAGAPSPYVGEAREILNKASTDFQKPTARLGKIQDALADSEQISDLLSGDVTETSFQQALTLLIKSMGREVGNIAERERKQYADLVGVPGMFRKGYRWVAGAPSPGQIESVREVARRMTANLAKRGRSEIRTQTGALYKRNRPVFEGAGIGREQLPDLLGLTLPETGGGTETDMITFENPETGVTEEVPASRRAEAIAAGWVEL